VTQAHVTQAHVTQAHETQAHMTQAHVTIHTKPYLSVSHASQALPRDARAEHKAIGGRGGGLALGMCLSLSMSVHA